MTEPRIGSCQNYRRPIVYTCQFVNDNYKSLETFDCAVMEKYFYQFSPWPPGLLNPVLATSAGILACRLFTVFTYSTFNDYFSFVLKYF